MPNWWKPSKEAVTRARLQSVPREWRVVALGGIATSQYGLSIPASDDGSIPILGMQHINDGRISTANAHRVLLDATALQKYTLQEGDLLFNRTNSYDRVGKTAVYEDNGSPHVFASYLIRLKIDTSRANPRFVSYFMNSYPAVSRLRSFATPGVSQYNINPTSLSKAFLIALPRKEEQDAIVAALSKWDRAISGANALIKSRRRLKRGLMQQLLTGRRRFGDFAGRTWQPMRLGELTIESSLRNNRALSADAVRAVNRRHGMIPMKEGLASANLDRYKLVRRGWFAYNPMRLNIGSIAMWRGDGDVLVSPDYVVFSCITERLDPRFLNQLRSSHVWSSFVRRVGNGSVRVRIYYSDVARMKLLLPPLEEQHRIATVLDACDREIDLLRQHLFALKQQKNALMQKLLTGQVRVPV